MADDAPTCANCARWRPRVRELNGEPVEGPPELGDCTLELPPWVARQYQPVTWADRGCSLHQPIPRETVDAEYLRALGEAAAKDGAGGFHRAPSLGGGA